MPYIDKDWRPSLDEAMEPLEDLLSEAYDDEIDGIMNYVITKLIHNRYRWPSYKAYNSAVGVLECVKLELYRRKIASYEDEKIKQNGDIYD